MLEKKDLILIILLIILIAIVGYAILEVKTESFKCLNNPISYGLKDFPNIYCYCNDGYIINKNGLMIEERVGG